MKGFTLPVNTSKTTRNEKSDTERKFEKVYENKFCGKVNSRM